MPPSMNIGTFAVVKAQADVKAPQHEPAPSARP
jgi:hypothetical protein